MKTRSLFLAFALFAAMSAVAEKQTGNGIVETKEVDVAPFESIQIDLKDPRGSKKKVQEAADVRFLYSQTPGKAALSVTIDENLFPFLEIASSGGVLTVKAKKGIDLFPTVLEFAVSSSGLKALQMSGSADFEAVTPITGDNFVVKVSGSGDVKMPQPIRGSAFMAVVSGSGSLVVGSLSCAKVSATTSGSGNLTFTFGSDRVSAFMSAVSGSGSVVVNNLLCDKMSGKVSGSGSLTLTGEAKAADLSVAGSGEVHSFDFKVGKAKIGVSGSGNVNIQAIESLAVKQSGSGNVRYRGNPRSVKMDISGSGTVKSE